MKFTVEREHLLKPLQQVSGPLGGRPTLPILGNLLLQVADGTLSLTGTDLEMEMVARVALVQPHEHSQQLLDYTIRNGAFAIFPLTPAFTVTGLGNPGRAFINSHGKNMAKCLEFISVHRVMAA